MWQRTKHTSKSGFDKLWGWADKLGAPVNRLSNRLGSEAFWPTTLDKESDKAARILRSFCKDGFYEEEVLDTTEGPQQKQKVLKKIPQEVIRDAVGLAIFTTMRSGLWVSGAGGSGILVGRTEDGSWSPPSGIMLHTAGLGFLVGVDIYDCVVVINTHKALEAFSKVRCTLGGEISAVAGPVGVGGVIESEVHKRQAPIFTYMKSRGFYAGVQVDGTVVIERTDENERFYGEQIGVADILAGKARHPPPEVRPLLETIKAAQGDTDIDHSLLSSEPPPGDFEVDAEDHTFGVPDKTDPYEEAREASEEAQEIENLEKTEEKKQEFESAAEKQTDPIPKVQVEDLPKLQVEDEESSQTTDSGFEEIKEKSEAGAGLGAPETNPVRFSTYDFENVAVEEPVVQQLRQAATPQAIRARLVTVKKLNPPRIPPRNPIRNRKGPLIINAEPHNDIHAHDSMSPRSPPSSSEHPSVSTVDSASTISSRDSFTSDEGMDAMSKRISVMRTSDSDETEGKSGKKQLSRNNSDDFHSVPATPEQRPRSPIEEDFS
ncbi:hypothetical protein UCDDS831_g02353 [Diplodia seriata]|uniref:Ysc84 actin-binding domain-containing protein n=1 Tax=Diplodia seriata TaxID=420778 RepID=A0A0G2H7S2_9PEZI|nr:hypothetical protein UCDDS831_g02353 [Diplodia seriata]